MATVEGTPSGAEEFPTTFQPYLGAVLLESFFYGVYTILFSICAFVLRRRQNTHWILPVFATAMYSLATADMAYTLWLLFDKLLQLELSYQALRWKYWMFVTNNVLADSLLLYRCYIVWEYDKRVVFGPALLLIAATVFGYLFEGSLSSALFTNAWIYPIITLFLNVILTLLTASRIWFLSRKARKFGTDLSKRYSVVTSILIESGIMYSLYIAVDLAFHRNPSGGTVLDASLIQVVGIVPTLIIVRIAVGRAVHESTNFRGRQIESAPVSTISSKLEIKPPTPMVRTAHGIAVRGDTRKRMFDVSLASPYRAENRGHKSSSSKGTFASPLTELDSTSTWYNPSSHVGDIEKGDDGDQYYEMQPANDSVLDYVLREDVEKGVEESRDNVTPLPGSAEVKKLEPLRSILKG